MSVVAAKSNVQLSFSCSKLKDLDTFSKSDPQIWVYIVDSSKTETLIGKTELIKNDLNPTFSKTVIVEYHFEQLQTLKVYVVDIDSKKARRQDHDSLGVAEAPLGRIASNGDTELPLVGGGKGKVKILAEELVPSRDSIQMKLRARDVDKKDFLGKSDPFLIFKRLHEPTGSYMTVHKTEVVKKTLNPQWKGFQISLTELANSKWDAPIVIECYDWDKGDKNDYIGSATVTPAQLREANATHSGIPLINAKKQRKKKKYKDSGQLFVEEFLVTEDFTFLDYIRSGYVLGLMCSIDFTGSNGDPSYQTSLHYLNPYQPNQYQQVLSSVGQILLSYISSGLIATYGYGAVVPRNADRANHCFPLTFNEANPYVAGVPGLMAAYQQAIANVGLSGPTNFAPSVDKAIAIAKAKPHEYLIVLMCTDGIVSDMRKTKKALIEASTYPISFVIVGVGSTDWSQMIELDGDEGLLREGTHVARRDCVQFVAFEDYKNKPINELAAEVLREIPAQYTASMKELKLRPIGM